MAIVEQHSACRSASTHCTKSSEIKFRITINRALPDVNFLTITYQPASIAAFREGPGGTANGSLIPLFCLCLVLGRLNSPRREIRCKVRLALDPQQVEAAVLHDDIDLSVVILSNISKQYGGKSKSRMVR